jgi:signal transduction histidine kinase
MILQDVTKFRLLDDAKTNLVGTVSHELKTPLTSLRMAVYLLLEENFGKLTPAQKDLLETARDDADRLLRILNDILDLSRIESGIASLNLREVAVPALLDDMAREMKAIAEDAQQTIVVRIAEGVNTVRVDPDRLRHVFINLLANASKYSPDGSTITLYAQPAVDAMVRFGVRDQGPGIAEESQPYVFEKFYRVPGQTRKGAGLGLTIAREIVLEHGGVIACSSRVGEGSDFYFLIPATSVLLEN